MPARTLPGLGLKAFFDLGENGWNDEFDDNIRILSAVVNRRVLSRTTNLPGSPGAGAIYIVPPGQPNAHAVAIWDETAPGTPGWVYLTPQSGWHFYVVNEEVNVQWNGSQWIEFAGGGGGGSQGVVEPFVNFLADAPFAGWESFAIPEGVSQIEAIIYVPATSQGVNIGFRFNNNDTADSYKGRRRAAYLTSTTNDNSFSTTSFLALRASEDADGSPQWHHIKISQPVPQGPVFAEVVTIVGDATNVETTVRWSNPSAEALSSFQINPSFGESNFPVGTFVWAKDSNAVGSASPVPFAGFRVGKDANQAITSGSIVPVTFQTEIFDTADVFDSSQFVVPANLDGRYAFFTGGFRFTTSPSTSAIYIQRSTDNGGTWTAIAQFDAANQATLNTSSGPVLLEEGHIYRLGVFVNANATIQNVAATFFSMGVLDPGISTGSGGGGGPTGPIFLNDLEDVDTSGATEGQALLRQGDGSYAFGDVASGSEPTGQNWAVPWRGATVRMNAQNLNLSTTLILSWDQQVEDTDNFWDGAVPTKFIIPPGIKRVRVNVDLMIDGSTATGSRYLAVRLNGTAYFVGGGQNGEAGGFSNQMSNVVTGVFQVQEGDEIDVVCQIGADTSVDVRAESYFQIEVVEVTDAIARPFDFYLFLPGAPSAGATVFQSIMPRTVYLREETETVAFAGVAPTSNAVFAITKNGVQVGTLTWLATEQEATVSVPFDVGFERGDRIAIVAPNPADATLADLTITLALTL